MSLEILKHDGPIADQYRLVNEMIFSPGAQTSQGIIGKKAFLIMITIQR